MHVIRAAPLRRAGKNGGVAQLQIQAVFLFTDLLSRMAEQPPVGNKLQNPDNVRAKRDQVLARYQGFKEAAKLRRERLESARKFQQFRRDADELAAWISEKIHIVSDESYKDRTNLQVGVRMLSRDEISYCCCFVNIEGGHRCAIVRSPTILIHIPIIRLPFGAPVQLSPHGCCFGLDLSLQAKIQKHYAFEAEVAAHNNSITSIKSSGRAMISQGHFAVEKIQVAFSVVSCSLATRDYFFRNELCCRAEEQVVVCVKSAVVQLSRGWQIKSMVSLSIDSMGS